MTHDPDIEDKASELEKADLAAVEAVADRRHDPLVRFAGALSEMADQPQLAALCGATIVAGLIRRDPRMARAGVAMLAAHALATWAKGAVKDAVDRTRPNVYMEEGRYEMRPGDSKDGRERSFPSGHTASAVAVAGALSRAYPAGAAPAYGLAAAVALIQVPRGKHYPSDLAGGLAIGLAAGYAVHLASSLLRRRLGDGD